MIPISWWYRQWSHEKKIDNNNIIVYSANNNGDNMSDNNGDDFFFFLTQSETKIYLLTNINITKQTTDCLQSNQVPNYFIDSLGVSLFL